MGSISNPGFSNLGRILAGSGAWLATAALLSPSAQTNLPSGAVGDLVQLSEQALQLQDAAGSLATSASTASANLLSSLLTPNYSVASSLDTSLLSASNSLLDSLSPSLTPSLTNFDTVTQAGSNTSVSWPPDQLAAYQAQLQIADTQTLFGLNSGTASSLGVNLLA